MTWWGKLSRLGHGLLIIIPLSILAGSGYWLYSSNAAKANRLQNVLSWMMDPQKHPEWRHRAGERCNGAPFQMPTDGFIGFYWDDSFRIGHRHQGIDIFSGLDENVTPVYAAFPGFLTRMPDWKSSVIVRIPEDPLQAGRQIWTYYTHMASPEGVSYVSPEFPPGAEEVWVEAGDLLGYQGNYSGDPGSPVGVHLHFSIVLDNGEGRWLNELEIQNTLDPSPYLGLSLNAQQNPALVQDCTVVP